MSRMECFRPIKPSTFERDMQGFRAQRMSIVRISAFVPHLMLIGCCAVS
jgi:hypothetical protein